MRDVRPPISFRFDITQNHIFNWQRQTRHFPRHIYTKIIKLWLLVGNQHIFKLTSFETTPCYHNNKKKYKINTIPYKSQPKQYKHRVRPCISILTIVLSCSGHQTTCRVALWSRAESSGDARHPRYDAGGRQSE